MLFVSIMVLAFVSRTVNGLRNCEDCVAISECPQAYEKISNNWNDELMRHVAKATCNEDPYLQICCSDFYLEKQNEDETDLENHPNINLLSDDCGINYNFRIKGGEDADPHEFPWLVLLEKRDRGRREFHCGGTLISSRYVLTAAHCLQPHNVVSVRVGEHDLSKRKGCRGPIYQCEDAVQDIPVSHKIIHPRYSSKKRNMLPVNDIALLRLKRPVVLTAMNAGVICLPVTSYLQERNVEGELGTVAGWGRTDNNVKRMSSTLQKAQVPISSPHSCGHIYLGTKYDFQKDQQFKNILCADEYGRGTCKGDSGGPIMLLDLYQYKYVQYGIVSYGIGCGTDKPTIYTDVTKHMKWILDTIKP